jgi:hypothetical protein
VGGQEFQITVQALKPLTFLGEAIPAFSVPVFLARRMSNAVGWIGPSTSALLSIKYRPSDIL